MFTPSQGLTNAVAEKDTVKVREEIVAYMAMDAYNERGLISPAVEYAEKNKILLFEPNNVELETEADSGKWDDHYLSIVTDQMLTNFSRERLDHWYQVSKAAKEKYFTEHPKAAKPAEAVKPQATPRAEPYIKPENGINPKFAAGIAAAAIVTAAVVAVVWATTGPK